MPKKRWKNGLGYQTQERFYRAIKKYGWNNFEHIVLYSNLTKEEACAKEQELILLYKTQDREFGYNSTSGGEFCELSIETREKMSELQKGRICKDETKRKLSQMNAGENHPMFGTHRSKSTREKISNSRKGITFSEEHKQRLSEAKKGRCFGKDNNNFRSVNQLNLNGEFICSWNSLADVERQLKICKANICRAIKYDRTAGGFKWEYLNT